MEARLPSANSPSAFGQFTFTDPRLNWQVLETEHFRIIFHQGLEGLAQEAATHAEGAFQFWAKELGYPVEGKTSIVLADNTDFDGGSADSGNKLIVINTSAARSFNEWLNSRDESKIKSVVYHEDGHVADLSGAAGLPGLLRRIFGTSILPTAAKPGPFTEGIPIYEDFRRTKGERASDPRDAMYLREMWLNDKLPLLDELLFGFKYNPRQWPSPYMIAHDVGPWLVRYTGEKYGPDKVGKLDHVLAGDARSLAFFVSQILQESLGLPISINLGQFPSVLRQTLGISPKEFYAGFKDWLKEQFSAQVESIKSEGVTSSKKISSLNYWNNKPAWSPHSDSKSQWIAYFHSDQDRGSQLRLMRPDGSEDHALVSIDPGVNFFRPNFWSPVPAWSPDGTKLVYATNDVSNYFYQFGDLYLYDLKTSKVQRLTQSERAFRPVFAPDGNQIIYAKYGWGDKGISLWTLDLKTGEKKSLKEFSDDLLLDSFSLSPDGKQLALSIWRQGGYQDIYTMPSEGGELTPITQDKATDLDPTWSPDGHFVLFSSDRSDVNNLYAYRVSDGNFLRVTNIVSGAFHPTVAPDGKQLAFVGYSVAGYEIDTMSFDPASWKQIPTPQKETISAWSGYPKTSYPIKPYQASETMAPLGWIPIISPERLGISVDGQDALLEQFYTLQLGYNLKDRWPFYALNYSTNHLLPPFTIALNLSAENGGNRQDLRFTYPIVSSFAEQQNFSFGVSRSEAKKLSQTVSLGWSLSQLTGLDLLWNRLNLSVNSEMTQVVAENKVARQFTFSLGDTINLRDETNHTLALRLIAGRSDQEKRFTLGGEKGRFLLRGFKLLSIWSGWELKPVFFREVYAHLFADGGLAGETLVAKDIKLSVGAELRLVANFFGIGSNFRVGVAQGLGLKQPVFYWDIGVASAF
ncbi:PD40 domain-containing protein [Candidatus Acetothermia bacterium]|nr:PD40 domain-containing protein [Candidatus Acetothermia bacterium]